MEKLAHLRQHLIDACPTLQRDPDKLLTFVEQGTIRFHVGANLSHAYSYTAQVVLTDFGANVDTVMVPLLYWLRRYEPGLQPDEAVTFDAEILSHDEVDLALSLPLTERVVVTVNEQGQHVATHYLDPLIEAPYESTEWEVVVQHSPEGSPGE